MRRWLWLSGLVVVLDQASKWTIVQGFYEGEVEQVTSFFNLVLAYNRGAAFSFLSEAGGWQRWFFIVLALGISAFLYRWLSQLKASERLTAISLSLILGGAWGNVIDRALYGMVTDFLDFHLNAWHWPAFNLADSAITLGVALLLWTLLPQKKTNGQR